MQVYLDNAATGQIHEDVQEAIKPYLEGQYFNPSSGYKEAQKVREDIEAAREKIAKYIGADPSEIIFTSGATEANNLFIQGIAKANPAKKHIITSVIEHPAVLEVCEFLRKDGYKVDYIPVSPDGLVDPQEIKKKITKDTLFVSIMHVNNEIGTIQPIEEISKICQENKVPFHTDAVQSFRKIDINVQ
ncbi:MAG: cysteine desulfurase, partial [Patescibacteria group bacterium]